MQYFTPRFQIATLAPPQDRLVSKIGGVPWGLPLDHWPTCCGHPQKLLAQLCHQPPMLDLGDENAVLHLFQCLECGGLRPGHRSLATFVLPRSKLDNNPAKIEGYDYKPALGEALIGEAFITGWDESDDGIPEQRLPEFFNEKSLWALQDVFSEIDWFKGRQRTKFGGSPRWTGNGPLDFPRRPFEFLFQIDCFLHVDGPPPTPDEVGCPVGKFTDVNAPQVDRIPAMPRPGMERINAPWSLSYDRANNEFIFEITNFGSDGTAFVFINRTRRPHQVKWYWNR